MTEILLSIIYAQYVLLFVGWALVFRHYGSTVVASWRAQHGKISRLAGDFLQPLGWAWGRVLCSLRIRSPDACADRPYSRYSGGTILRAAITVTSVAPMLSFIRPLLGGSLLGTAESMIWHSFILTFSCLGCVVHLYVAYQQTPARWVAFSTLASIWFVLGPVLVYLIRM